MTVIDEIASERKRQVEAEGYDAAHDDSHDKGELVLAACCYAAPDRVYVKDDRASGFFFVDPWPWELHYDKRRYDGNMVMPNYRNSSSRRRKLLVKAAALIVAEIERLDRHAR